MRTSIVRLLVVLSLVGCGGDDGDGAGPGDPVSSDEANAVCTDFANHADECGWGGNINEADWNCGEAAVVWRADVFRAVAECAIALDCGGVGATCLEEVTGAEPLDIHEEYADTCAARKGECDLVGDSDTSSAILLCSADAFAPYASTVIDAILSCFDEQCDSVVPCLDDVL